MADTMKAASAAALAERQPILMDLGKKKRKNIKRLRRGTGPLMRAVSDAIAELRSSGTVDAGQDIVVVVRERRRRRDSGFGW
jgi:hypothetical protein